MAREALEVPAGAAVSTLVHRVPFFDTDAMGVVHHANYLRYLELARVLWLEEHHMPYQRYLEDGLHFAVIRCEARYRRGARFGDELRVHCWLQRVAGGSLDLGYRVERDGELLADAETEHAMVDDTGRPRRIPRERRLALRALAERNGTAA